MCVCAFVVVFSILVTMDSTTQLYCVWISSSNVFISAMMGVLMLPTSFFLTFSFSF